MKLEQILEAANYAIGSGAEYLWQCYPDARIIDLESDYAFVSVVYSTKNQEVYEINLNSTDGSYPMYRWLNPDFKEAMFTEAKYKNIEPHIALDDDRTLWVDTDTESDILKKVSAMINNEEVDRTVEMLIDFPDNDELLRAMIAAHEANMTFNDFCQMALVNLINMHKKELNANS